MLFLTTPREDNVFFPEYIQGIELAHKRQERSRDDDWGIMHGRSDFHINMGGCRNQQKQLS